MIAAEPLTFEMKAEFLLDKNGAPISFEETEGGRTFQIYRIKLILEPPAAAPEPRRVTFLLDDSYLQPVRKASRSGNRFVEEITSFGDFHVTAKYQAGDYFTAKAALLSELLRNGHGPNPSDAIQHAILAIQKN